MTTGISQDVFEGYLDRIANGWVFGRAKEDSEIIFRQGRWRAHARKARGNRTRAQFATGHLWSSNN